MPTRMLHGTAGARGALQRPSIEGGEVTASLLFDGHAEGAQDSSGSFDDSNADSGAAGDPLAGGGDAAPGLSLCQEGMCDGDSECCFGADDVFLTAFGAGGGVEQGSDLVLPLGATGPDGGSGVLASGYGQSPGVSSLPTFGVQRLDAGDVFGGHTYCCDPCVGETHTQTCRNDLRAIRLPGSREQTETSRWGACRRACS